PGGVITRRAVVQLATESAPGAAPTASFAGRRWLWYFLAPLYPLLAILLLTIPIAFVGLFVWVAPGFGTALVGLGWLLVAILSIGAMWLFGGLIVRSPLLCPAIRAGRGGDPFHAFRDALDFRHDRRRPGARADSPRRGCLPLHVLLYGRCSDLLAAASRRRRKRDGRGLQRSSRGVAVAASRVRGRSRAWGAAAQRCN